jgi:hypothetical protein
LPVTSHVDATASRNDGPDSYNCGYPGLSRQSYNASAFFENRKFQVRARYNWRGHFAASCNGGAATADARRGVWTDRRQPALQRHPDAVAVNVGVRMAF